SLSGITNINIVYVTGKPEIYNALKVDKNDRDTVVYGSIEDAKIYIKYSHVIIINENLALQFKKGTLDFNNEKIYLTDISNNNLLMKSVLSLINLIQKQRKKLFERLIALYLLI